MKNDVRKRRKKHEILKEEDRQDRRGTKQDVKEEQKINNVLKR